MNWDDNLTAERATFVTHLECSLTGERYEADRLHGLSAAGRPLLVRYDLAGAKAALDRGALAGRPMDMWRWRELLPVRRSSDIVSLGEMATPLVSLGKAAGRIGVGALLVKDEGRLPTGSFKARGIAMAVSMAKVLGVTKIAMPTNGNAGAALAAYAARAGIEAVVLCPDDTPEINVREIAAQGARVWRVNGLIDECGALVGEGAKAGAWFDLSTLKEPYRIEGKKTMGLELAEQLDWQLPDAIFYPTGGGTGLIGMWKRSRDGGARLHWLRRPRMVAGRRKVRADGASVREALRMPSAAGATRRGIRCRGGRRFLIWARSAKASASRSRAGTRDRGRDRARGARGRADALSGRRCHAGSGQTGTGARPDRRGRPGRVVQLRDRPQISAAGRLPPARPPRALRSLRALAFGGIFVDRGFHSRAQITRVNQRAAVAPVSDVSGTNGLPHIIVPRHLMIDLITAAIVMENRCSVRRALSVEIVPITATPARSAQRNSLDRA